jgi:hypothetical protein
MWCVVDLWLHEVCSIPRCAPTSIWLLHPLLTSPSTWNRVVVCVQISLDA